MISLEQCKEITKQYDLLILLYELVTLYVVFLMYTYNLINQMHSVHVLSGTVYQLIHKSCILIHVHTGTFLQHRGAHFIQ